MEFKRHSNRGLRHFISLPFIWTMLVPLLLFDLSLEIYHHICFPLYGLKMVKRSKYMRFDRHHLSYLSLIERGNCIYCSYANGLMRYAKQIAAHTEAYWCGIKHHGGNGYIEDGDQCHFLEYGDENGYHKVCPKSCPKKKK